MATSGEVCCRCHNSRERLGHADQGAHPTAERQAGEPVRASREADIRRTRTCMRVVSFPDIKRFIGAGRAGLAPSAGRGRREDATSLFLLRRGSDLAGGTYGMAEASSAFEAMMVQ